MDEGEPPFTDSDGNGKYTLVNGDQNNDGVIDYMNPSLPYRN